MGNTLLCSSKKQSTTSISSSFQSNHNDSFVEGNKDLYFNETELKYYEKQISTISESQINSKIIWIPLNQPLGQGSYGQVILGMEQNSGQYMAVKQLSLKGFNITNTDYRIQSFKLEIDLLQKLQHPNIVKYLGMEQTNTHINLFLEYVAGGSIQSLIYKYGKFSEALLRKYTKQILLGLEYLHSHGIIHRDIKGANVLVDNNGICKLADFGSSKRLSELIQNEDFRSLIGTPNWMAPEVIQQSGHGRFADIWSVGCTVIEMASGRPPWAECGQRNQLAFLMQIVNSKSPPPYPNGISADCKDFLDKCFSHEPSKRFNVKKLLEHQFVTMGLPNISVSDQSAQMNMVVNKMTEKLLTDDKQESTSRDK